LPSWDPASQDRLRGFNDALNAAGLESDPELIRVGALNPGTGYQLVNDILEKNALPDGILLANTRLAVGGLRALAHAELNFPTDIKVGAFHDTSALDDYASDLFRVVQPSYDMGKIATKLLLEEITRSGDEFEEIVIPAELHLPGDPALGLPETVSRDSVRLGH
jgi:DNA-binding LacI/PurR family transcriptional regulator